MNDVRIGVFVCHCGTNIGGFIDVQGVVEYAKRLPGVVHADHSLYTCADDGLSTIKTAITDHRLNRVVVAACTPRTHGPLFRSACKSAGLNPYLFEFVNIRDQCSWVHMKEKEKATAKAKDLVRMGVAKAALLEPDEDISIDVEPSALVIGGGIAGMTAALSLANQGFVVYIVEKEKELGGMVNNLHSLFPSYQSPTRALETILDDVWSHERIQVLVSAAVQDLKGYIGNFEATVNRDGEEVLLRVGTIIVATGAVPLEPEGLYRYHDSERVITQFELEQRMNAGLAPSDDIVMIQCAGSRGQSVPYCSRICCMVAIKNAILLKEMNPGARISILHNDIQVYGEEYEPQYRSAREKGIFFIKFSPERPPVVGDTSCKVYDSMIREELDIPADMVVLATPLVPAPDTEQLSRILKVPLGQDKFFFEAHVKLRPVDFANAGIYVCGTARGPAGIQESVEQALATASRAGIPLWNRVYITDAIGSIIDPELCTGCGVCESLCPYGAIRVEDKKAHTIKALCKGCGTCGAACPTHAITLSHFTDEQIQAQIHAALQERQKGEVKVIAFCCNWCSYAGADFAGVARFQYPPNTRIIRVMCSARIDPVFVFDALTSGADGVLISGCHLQDCHYIDGNVETLRRYDILHSVFEPYGLDGRIRLEWVSASEGERFSQITKSFVDQVKSLGKIGEDDLRNLEHLKGVFQGKKLRLLLGLARKSIRKGVPEEQYRERILHTIHQEMEAALKRDEEAKTLAAATRTITADLSSPVLARGGTLMVTGAVTGPPPKEIAVWVFGEGLRLYDHIPVDTRNRFSFVLHPADTGQMKTGEYSVIFQHPGENDRFDVVREVAGEDIVVKTVQDDAQVRPEGTMTAGSAAAVLTDMITSGDLDDLVTDVQFYVQEPFIRINPVPDKDIDESFTISGFTNIAEGEVLSVVISPIQSEKKRFYPVDDCVLTAHVRSGDDGENPWSADIPCSLGQPQEYRILVSSGKGAITTGKLSVKWR